jgi:hypothetical protein
MSRRYTDLENFQNLDKSTFLTPRLKADRVIENDVDLPVNFLKQTPIFIAGFDLTPPLAIVLHIYRIDL